MALAARSTCSPVTGDADALWRRMLRRSNDGELTRAQTEVDGQQGSILAPIGRTWQLHHRSGVEPGLTRDCDRKAAMQWVSGGVTPAPTMRHRARQNCRTGIWSPACADVTSHARRTTRFADQLRSGAWHRPWRPSVERSSFACAEAVCQAHDESEDQSRPRHLRQRRSGDPPRPGHNREALDAVAHRRTTSAPPRGNRAWNEAAPRTHRPRPRPRGPDDHEPERMSSVA